MLYLVSVPIGNLGDITARAREVLESADLVACEDTRTSGRLFGLLGLRARKLTPYHEHNAEKARPKLIARLMRGEAVALVSDAGTPLISDPGYKLARDCRAQGIPMTAVPGANALLPAVQLSGLPTDAFYFGGFLPDKSAARRRALQAVQSLPATLVFYESPNRLIAALEDIAAVLGDRTAAVARELTKKFEEVRRAPVSELVGYYKESGAPKGEIVIVIDRGAQAAWTEDAVGDLIRRMLRTHSARDTAALVGAATGLPRKHIYKQVLDAAGHEP
ncbi:MAG: 16S rRNA (cytidine(1402)-2'-O)-methyltransferase [Alphaproteobacteria bacterium]|nr:16S rRNA (cytidine(1402)-2'-O)-methyltransferase [Alphaproteobacteria bacterium]